MDKPFGALVRSVVENEAAEKSGILPGDVIVEIDGKEIIYFKDLQHNIGRTRPNTSVVAKLFREGKYMDINIIVGELPTPQEAVETKEEPKNPNYPLGMNLREIDPDTKAPSDPEKGLRVLRVFSNSPAFGQIFEGDIITKITSKNKSYEITSLDSLTKTLESFDTGDIILIIGTRNGTNLFEPVEIE